MHGHQEGLKKFAKDAGQGGNCHLGSHGGKKAIKKSFLRCDPCLRDPSHGLIALHVMHKPFFAWYAQDGQGTSAC